MQSSGSGRQVGVTVPRSQLSAGQGQPNSVQNFMPVQMAAVQYADDAGRIHNEVFMLTGGKVYSFPDGERWAAALRPVPKWLSDKVAASFAALEAKPPSTDSVDVISESVDDVVK